MAQTEYPRQPRESAESGFFRTDVLFNGHVSELARVKNIASFLAFYVLSVFVARNYADARMPADFLHHALFEGFFC